MSPDSCKHFNGIQHDRCDAGVRYDELRRRGAGDGPRFSLPCIPSMRSGRATSLVRAEVCSCSRFELPTAAELAAADAQQKASAERLAKVLPLLLAIKVEHEGRSASGEKPCPCCGGTVHWTIAGCNGHLRAACTTEGCIHVIE